MADRYETIVKDRLNMYFLLDSSCSMYGVKMQQLNDAMQNLKVIEAEAKNEGVDVIIRVIEFGNSEEASWYVGTPDLGINIKEFKWENLESGNNRPTASAIEMVTNAIDWKYLGERVLKPFVMLVSNGGCTEGKPKYTKACQHLVSKHGEKVIRAAIALDGSSIAELEAFASKDIELNKPMVYNPKDASDIIKLIRWVDTVELRAGDETPMGKNQQTGNALPDPGRWIP
ncbi:MAG: hypothetical protein FWG98_02405 [Candidatus Cloacimonetes bacterium]|nr:hypothetical protein [Candidatus Cloacimonadota bacterium]